MKFSVSDLLFPGFQKEALPQLSTRYGIEFFYEFGKNYYWDKEILLWKNRTFSIHAPCVAVNLADPSDKEAYLSIFEKTFAYAKKCRAAFVVIHTNEAIPGNLEGTKKQVRAKLKQLCKLAKEYGVQIAIENVGLGPKNNDLFSLPDYLQLFEEFPDAKALLDTGHAHVNGWDPAQVAEALGSRLIACHVHDNDGSSDQHLPVGQGTIEWKPFFAALKKLPSPPVLVLEYAQGFADAKSLEQHIRALKKMYRI